ncbi:MAG: hypothetical protein EBU90_29405, partial [Proteobacteria bacterium]|nr:hypothetical protein [Pseudomonadota bacterium]
MESKIIHKKTILNKNFFDVHNDGVMLLHNVEIEISSRYENDEFNKIISTEVFYLQVTSRNKTESDFVDSDQITDDIILNWLSD